SMVSHREPSEAPERFEADESPTRIRWLVLLALAFAAIHSYLTRVSVSPATSTIQAELGLSAVQMGQILGRFFSGYTLFQIPGAWIGGRAGARRALTGACLAWSACHLATAAARSYELLWWSRFLGGIAQAALYPVAALVVRDWFPPERRGSAS